MTFDRLFINEIRINNDDKLLVQIWCIVPTLLVVFLYGWLAVSPESVNIKTQNKTYTNNSKMCGENV